VTQAAGETGAGPMVTVAIEQGFPPGRRIVDDDLAYSILPLGMRALVWLMRKGLLRDWSLGAGRVSRLPGRHGSAGHASSE
jgi:hypothetical protein